METVRVLAMIILERVLTRIQLSESSIFLLYVDKQSSIQPASLVSVILPLTNYLLNVTLPIKQTDHYLIKTFLRVILFMNDNVLSNAVVYPIDHELCHGNVRETSLHSRHHQSKS